MNPDRRGVALVGAVCCLVIAIACWLSPDPRGYGTHERLLLPPCAFRALFGIPCPSCGLTTSFALVARFRVAAAARSHLLGVPLFVVVGWVCVASALTLWRGQPYWPFGGRDLTLRAALAGAAAVAAAWGANILRARS